MDEITITSEMIAAGVVVYANPGRYESYDDMVVRIFCAMFSASPMFASRQVHTLNKPE